MYFVLAMMTLAVFLFATDYLRVDVAAILIMTILGLASSVPGFENLVGSDILFSGLASNAVVSIIAVMIMGRGLDKTGVMEQLARSILRYGGHTESRVVAATSTSVALISSMMQNIGAAALFLPVISRISAQSGFQMSRMLMPMGFCAILGGTLTMVASSPLIMLNDLIDSANHSLGPESHIRSFELFDVTPVGIVLVACGLLYFLTIGRWLLPADEGKQLLKGGGTVRYMRRIHGVDAAVREVEVPVGSVLVGREIASLQREFEVRLVATKYMGKVVVAPSVEAEITAPATLAVIAKPARLRRFVVAGGLTLRPKLKDFRYLLARSIAGVAELVVPPESAIIGKTVLEARIRARYGLSLLSIFRDGIAVTEGMFNMSFQAGDMIMCHTRWEDLARLENDRDFVVVTSQYPHEERHPYKIALALWFFALAIGLTIFTDINLPVALLTGALGMILSGVLTIDEAYQAVSWQTVFLLAGLLPLGHAVATSGVADFIALSIVGVLGTPPSWVLQTALAVLATAFTLLMSNVGASVILVPIAISTALAIGADPAVFALTIAISASNSFILPTHQVNALIMGPGKYRVADFLRVGGIMTLIFLVATILVLNILF